MTPFELQDRSEIQMIEPQPATGGSLTGPEAEIIRETDLSGTVEALASTVAGLSSAIAAAASTVAARDAQRLASQPELHDLRGAGLELAALFTGFERRRDKVADSRALPEEKTAAMAEAREVLDLDLAALAERTVSQQGDAILDRFPPPSAWPVPPHLAPSAEFLVSSSSTLLPEAVINRAIEALQLARDTTATTEERRNALILLAEVHVPVLDRFSQAFPRHWTKFAPVAAELAATLRLHVEIERGAGVSRRAAEVVSKFRQDFRFVTTMAKTHGWQDEILGGAPSFRAAPPSAQ